MSVAALAGYLLFALGNRLAAALDLETKVRNIDLILRMGSVGIGVLVLTILFANRSANQFMTDVVDELGRVTWPSQRDTASATLVVIVMVLISGVILGLLDILWARAIQVIL